MNYTIHDAYFGVSRGPKSKHFEKILTIIAKKGPESKTSILKILNKEYSVISNSVDSLLENNMIQKTKVSSKKKSKEIFYYLTNKTVRFLIDTSIIELDDLWNLLFVSCRYNKHLDEMIEIKNNLDYYIHNKSKTSKRYFMNFISTNVLDMLRNIKESKKELLKESIPILQKLSTVKSINSEDFIQSMGLGKLNREYYKETLIPQLVISGLVYYWNKPIKNNKITIEIGLSHLGLLVVFDEIMTKIQNDEINIPKLEHLIRSKEGKLKNEFTETIQEIVKKQKHLLPHIFENWSKLRKIVPNGEYGLFASIILPHSEEKSLVMDTSDQHLGSILINLQYSMEIEFKKRIKEIFLSGMKQIRKLGYENNCTKYLCHQDENSPSGIISFLEFSVMNKKIPIEHAIESMSYHDDATWEGVKELIDRYKEINELTGKHYKFSSTHEQKYYESKIDKIDLIKLLKIYENPIREISKLYNIVRSGSDFFNQFSHDVASEDLKPISSIMSFYCYIILYGVAEKNEWNEFFESKENIELKKWFNEWMDYLISFEKEKINSLESIKIKN